MSLFKKSIRILFGDEEAESLTFVEGLMCSAIKGVCIGSTLGIIALGGTILASYMGLITCAEGVK